MDQRGCDKNRDKKMACIQVHNDCDNDTENQYNDRYKPDFMIYGHGKIS